MCVCLFARTCESDSPQRSIAVNTASLPSKCTPYKNVTRLLFWLRNLCRPTSRSTNARTASLRSPGGSGIRLIAAGLRVCGNCGSVWVELGKCGDVNGDQEMRLCVFASTFEPRCSAPPVRRTPPRTRLCRGSRGLIHPFRCTCKCLKETWRQSSNCSYDMRELKI